MARKLHLGARQPSGRVPLMRRRVPSTVISKCSLRIPANSTLTTTVLSVAYRSVLGTQLARADPSRVPPRERVTKCTDELTLHMAISAENYTNRRASASAVSFHFHQHLGPLPLARAKHNRALGSRGRDGRAATMTVPLKTEFATAKSAPQQQPSRRRYDYQRNQRLPIHGRNITSNSSRATNVFRMFLFSALIRARDFV